MIDLLKIFFPSTIPDNPLPTAAAGSTESSQSGTADIIQTEKIPDNPLPKADIAQETISGSLNTLSKKILGVYEFIQQGALQIGKYISGVSGEIKISPDGIVARNKDGDTTFAVDGETGDATFKGIVKARDFVVSDERGLISLSSFSVQTAVPTATTSTKNAMEDDLWDDVPNASLTLSPDRDTYYLVGFTANAKNTNGLNGDLAFFRFLLDATVVGPQLLEAGNPQTIAVGYETVSTVFIITVPGGSHTLKAQIGTSGGGTAQTYVAYPFTNQFFALKLGG